MNKIVQPVSVGDLVDVKGFNIKGTVLSLSKIDNKANVLVGNIRLNIDIDRIVLSKINTKEMKRQSGIKSNQPNVEYHTYTPELDLHGLRTEEAIIKLDAFLDKAIRDNMSKVRIIHGIGTGTLLKFVRKRLSENPLAKSFKQESQEHGGAGATLVELA